MKWLLALPLLSCALASAACAPPRDGCEDFACSPDRICADLWSGPTCVCPDETAAADGGPCVEVDADDDAPEDAGTP